MKLATLNWNYQIGEGTVKYTQDFTDAHFVVQLDLLQDCIAELTKRYDEILTSDANKEKP